MACSRRLTSIARSCACSPPVSPGVVRSPRPGPLVGPGGGDGRGARPPGAGARRRRPLHRAAGEPGRAAARAVRTAAGGDRPHRRRPARVASQLHGTPSHPVKLLDGIRAAAAARGVVGRLRPGQPADRHVGQRHRGRRGGGARRRRGRRRRRPGPAHGGRRGGQGHGHEPDRRRSATSSCREAQQRLRTR